MWVVLHCVGAGDAVQVWVVQGRAGEGGAGQGRAGAGQVQGRCMQVMCVTCTPPFCPTA